MTHLRLEDIHVEYDLGGGRILAASRGVNLEIGRGEIIAIVGESGCGKSTVGKVALGTLRPTRGRVFYGEHDIWAPEFRWTPALRSQVQVVHQDPFSSLNPVRTIAQTLEAPLRLAVRQKGATSRIEEEMNRLLEMVGLTPPGFYLEKYPFQLSGGQKQRVSIARATIMQPAVILADEPVSAVDASMRLSILDLMGTLQREQGISFLYITHDLATARYFARDGRLMVMYLGECIEEGPIGAVLDDPRHPYLKALLAAIPVPDPRRAKERRELPLKSFDVPSPVDLPPGCVFRPRCPVSVARCEGERPRLEALDDGAGAGGHRVSCFVAMGDEG